MKNRITKITMAIILLVGAPMLFLYLTFTNSKDCSQIVIDTYEIYSGINIPKVESINCYYDEASSTRISVYDLKADFPLDNFELVEFSDDVESFQGSYLLAETETPKVKKLYLAKGEKWSTEWTYLVDPQSKRLWASLNYTKE